MHDKSTLEDSLFERAIAIRDMQRQGVPVTWTKLWKPWLDDLRAYELTQQQPAPAVAVEQMELL